jgi:hypothetical protein
LLPLGEDVMAPGEFAVQTETMEFLSIDDEVESTGVNSGNFICVYVEPLTFKVRGNPQSALLTHEFKHLCCVWKLFSKRFSQNLPIHCVTILWRLKMILIKNLTSRYLT